MRQSGHGSLVSTAHIVENKSARTGGGDRRGERAEAQGPHHPINQAHSQPRGASLQLHHEHVAEVLCAGAGAGGLSRKLSSSLNRISWAEGKDKEPLGLEGKDSLQSQYTGDLRKTQRCLTRQGTASAPGETTWTEYDSKPRGRDRPKLNRTLTPPRPGTQCIWDSLASHRLFTAFSNYPPHAQPLGWHLVHPP